MPDRRYGLIEDTVEFQRGRATAALAVLAEVVDERDRLRAAIEDYLLWEPGRAGHAAAVARLRAALTYGKHAEALKDGSQTRHNPTTEGDPNG